MKKLLILTILLLAAPIFAQTIGSCLNQQGPPNPFVYCSSAPVPNYTQKASQVSSGSVASINRAFTSNTKQYSTLIVVFANGNNNNPTAPITDTLGLTWYKAVQVANSTAFETEIWYSPNTVGGADTITVTPGGTNASIAMEIYEVPGLVYPPVTGQQAIDQTTSNTGTGSTSPSVSITPIVPNDYVFVGFGLGTAAQTITVTAPYNNDSGQQNPTTPSGLFSFVSASLWKSEMATSSPNATATSEPWAVAVASFKTLSIPVQGIVQGLGIFQVSPTAAANSATNPFFQEPTDGTSAMGAMANFGTSPGAVKSLNVNASIMSGTTALGTPNTFGTTAPNGNALGVNASLFIGTSLVSASVPVPISATASANAVTNPIYVGTLPTPTTSSSFALAPPYEVDALTTAATVKSSAGNVYGYNVTNTNTTICYLQVFNTTSPTLGTTAPVISIGIPVGSNGGAGTESFTIPVQFSTAIAVAATTASKGSTTCTTGMTVNIYYQ